MKIISLITLGHGKWVSNVCENTNGDLHKLYHDFTIFTTTYAVHIYVHISRKYPGYNFLSDVTKKVLWLHSLKATVCRMMYPKAIGSNEDMSLFDWLERFHCQIKMINKYYLWSICKGQIMIIRTNDKLKINDKTSFQYFLTGNAGW